MRSDPSPESPLDWLLATCGDWLRNLEVEDSPDAGPGLPAIPTTLDPERLARLAHVHQLEPLLGSLELLGSLGLSGSQAGTAASDHRQDLGAIWQRAYFENLAFNSRTLDVLAALSVVAARESVPIAVLKGPALIARTTGDAGFRVLVDLDLLCRRSDLIEASRCAVAAGFEPIEHNASYHLHFRHREAGIDLELHFDLYDFLPRSQELLTGLLNERTGLILDGSSFHGLGLEDDLVFHLAHLIHHDLAVGIRPFLDLAALITCQRSRLRLDRLEKSLERFDLRHEFELLAKVLSRVFGVDLRLLANSESSENSETEGPTGKDLEADELFDQLIGDFESWGTDHSGRAMADTLSRSSWRSREQAARRLLFPPLHELMALHQTPSRLRALRFVPGHALGTLNRGWRKLRLKRGDGGKTSPRKTPGISLKRRAYRRRRATD